MIADSKNTLHFFQRILAEQLTLNPTTVANSHSLPRCPPLAYSLRATIFSPPFNATTPSTTGPAIPPLSRDPTFASSPPPYPPPPHPQPHPRSSPAGGHRQQQRQHPQAPTIAPLPPFETPLHHHPPLDPSTTPSSRPPYPMVLLPKVPSRSTSPPSAANFCNCKPAHTQTGTSGPRTKPERKARRP